MCVALFGGEQQHQPGHDAQHRERREDAQRRSDQIAVV